MRQQALREAALAQALNHRNVVATYRCVLSYCACHVWGCACVGQSLAQPAPAKGDMRCIHAHPRVRSPRVLDAFASACCGPNASSPLTLP